MNPEAVIRDHGLRFVFGDLEEFFVSPLGFGVETATPLQRAVCRIIEGRPLKELATHPHVVAAVGELEEGHQPELVDILAGIRTAKSMKAAAVAVWATQTIDATKLAPGEVPRFSCLSLRKDLADVLHGHIVGAVQNSPALRPLLLAEPTAETIRLRGLGGREFEIKVVAGARAGATLVARWSAGVVLDEFPRMVGRDEGVVNADDAVNAVRGRLLEGAQILRIGSPWAPHGPAYEAVQAHWRRPTRTHVVIKARADWLNPYWWTKERMDRLRAEDPRAYRTDVEAEFADAEEALLPRAVLDPVTRQDEELPPNPLAEYVAAIDPASRGNAFALAVGHREGNATIIDFVDEWIGTPVRPLSPRTVLAEIAARLSAYKLDWVYTDQWAADALRDLGEEVGLHLVEEPWTAQNRTKAFLGLAAEAAEGRVSLPNHRGLLKDLNLIQRKPVSAGIQIVLPKTPDGRHCDFGPPIAKIVSHYLEDLAEAQPEPGTEEYWERWEAEQIEREKQALREELEDPYGAEDEAWT